MDKIIIKGARENNLKNVNIELPKNKLIVMTGVSGSGKSSLAFDTIYEEGRRRYAEQKELEYVQGVLEERQAEYERLTANLHDRITTRDKYKWWKKGGK